MHLLIFSCLMAYISTGYGASLTTTVQEETPFSQKVSLHFHLEPEEILLRDFIKISALNNYLEVSEWQAERESSSFYDKSLNKKILGWKDTISISFTVQVASDKMPDKTSLIIHYMTTKNSSPQDEVITLHFASPSPTFNPVSTNTTASLKKPLASSTSFITKFQNYFSHVLISLNSSFEYVKSFISNQINNQKSFWIQLLFVFILGILMSLTPCIYPMIPITIGVLQTSTNTSLVRNFSLAACYTLGLSCTFAILGVLAACGSIHFGQLLGNPVFVLAICTFLIYLSFSMFGFYELYIPRFLQPKSHTVKQGSLVSAFIFGIMSGSFASPCLSPGLLLLLSICATIGHKIYSFLLLFFFGFGLGLPLLIIGTFTSSLTLLPRAGMWMVEVKKIFGFLLLGMCLFYASTFITPITTLFIITFAFMITGLYYIASSTYLQSIALRRFKYIVGTVCIILSFISAAETYKVYSFPHEETWLMDYQEAREIALKNNKKILVDFGAAWCTLCKKIDMVIFQNPDLQEILQQFVLVKIDCTNAHNKQCQDLTKQFNVKGYPALRIVEPEQEIILYSAGAELLDKKNNEFIALLESYQ